MHFVFLNTSKYNTFWHYHRIGCISAWTQSCFVQSHERDLRFSDGRKQGAPFDMQVSSPVPSFQVKEQIASLDTDRFDGAETVIYHPVWSVNDAHDPPTDNNIFDLGSRKLCLHYRDDSSRDGYSDWHCLGWNYIWQPAHHWCRENKCIWERCTMWSGLCCCERLSVRSSSSSFVPHDNKTTTPTRHTHLIFFLSRSCLVIWDLREMTLLYVSEIGRATGTLSTKTKNITVVTASLCRKASIFYGYEGSQSIKVGYIQL